LFDKEEKHGGNIYKFSEILNREIDDILDFSANINPLGIPELLKEMLLSNMESLVHYPDPEYTRLRNRLSQYTGIEAERIIPGNGSSEIIFLLLKALKHKNILIPAPSFLEYEQAAKGAGINIRFLELNEKEGFRLNVELIMQEIASGIECIILCNPNNPTSTLLPREDMHHVIKSASRCGTTVIVDEAFIELTVGGAGNSIISLVKEYDNLFVIRAFTKVFAVPGLRLGYGIGNENLVKRMGFMQQPWSVNSLAACAADFLPEASEYLKRTEDWLKVEKEWLQKSLCSIPDLKAYEPKTNFILVKLPKNGMDAAELKKSMASRGILIRDGSNFRFLGKHFFRVAVRDRPSNQILIRNLKSLCNNLI
jgi:threonine-phosphate decarboxylase